MSGGKKNNKVYRIVTVDESKKNRTRVLDTIGFWDKKKVTLNKDLLLSWLNKGAKMSQTVAKISQNQYEKTG